MTSDIERHEAEARIHAHIARREGKTDVAGAMEAAAVAWGQRKIDLANSLEREAGRMEFTAEARREAERVDAKIRTHLKGETALDTTAFDLILIESAWKRVAEWSEVNPEEAADAWCSGSISLTESELKILEVEMNDAVDQLISDDLNAWLRCRKMALICSIKYIESASKAHPTPRGHQLNFVIAWIKSAVAWINAADAWAVGDASRAKSWERSVAPTGLLGRAVAARTEEEAGAWLSAHRAQDAGHTEAAKAWEHAAKAHAEGKTKIAEAWESATYELEDASTEESAASSGPEESE